MAEENLLEKIAEILKDPNIAGNLVFGKNTEEGNEAIVKSNLQKKVVKEYSKAFSGFVKRRTAKRIISYTATDSEIDEILLINSSEIPRFNKIIKIPTNDEVNVGEIKNTKFTAFHFQNDEENIIVLREYKTSPFLSKSRLDRLIFSGDVLTFSGKDSIRVDRKIDCLVYQDMVIIFKRGGFEQIFDFTKVYASQANKIFNYFEKEAPYKIHNLKNLKSDCKGLLVLRKASNVFDEENYKTITIEKIKKFSDHNPDLKIKVNTSSKTVDFGNLQNMLRFFDEVYYSSETTGNKYIALFKKKR